MKTEGHGKRYWYMRKNQLHLALNTQIWNSFLKILTFSLRIKSLRQTSKLNPSYDKVPILQFIPGSYLPLPIFKLNFNDNVYFTKDMLNLHERNATSDYGYTDVLCWIMLSSWLKTESVCPWLVGAPGNVQALCSESKEVWCLPCITIWRPVLVLLWWTRDHHSGSK